MKKFNLHCALLAGILWASADPVVAEPIKEFEPNDTIASAQKLTFTVPPGITVSSGGTPKGSATVKGVIGDLTGPAAFDSDFYSFEGQVGDKVTIDIDYGMGGDRNVDTNIAIFGAGKDGPYTRLMWSDDPLCPPGCDEGSTSRKDPIIVEYLLTYTGTYTVGVSNRLFTLLGGGATLSNYLSSSFPNGDYTLIISGVTSKSLLITIPIDIKPGEGESDAPINPKSKGKIPVALLSFPPLNFKAVDVKIDTLKFGAKGDEESLSKCNKGGEDVNGDGLLDLVCHFENQQTGLTASSEVGIVTGTTGDGTQFEGRGNLKMKAVKPRLE
jgi:hypothetical protein